MSNTNPREILDYMRQVEREEKEAERVLQEISEEYDGGDGYGGVSKFKEPLQKDYSSQSQAMVDETQLREHLAYVEERDCWFGFNPKVNHWVPVNSGFVDRAVIEFMRGRFLIVGQPKDEGDEPKMVVWEGRESQIRNLVKQLKVDLRREADTPTGLIPINNGYLQFNRGEFGFFDFNAIAPNQHLFTWRSKANYREDITHDEFATSMFGRYIESSLAPNSIIEGRPRERQDLLQQWYGYVLSGEFTQRKMMLLIGASGTGKSSTAQILSHLLGGRGRSISMKQMLTDFGLEGIADLPLVVMEESDADPTSSKTKAGKLKEWTTPNETVIVNPKGRAQYSTRFTPRLMLIANSMPSFWDSDPVALKSRMLLITYYKPAEGTVINPTLVEDVAEHELDFVLWWALRGYESFHEHGGRFIKTQQIEETVDNSYSGVAPHVEFFETMVEFTGGDDVVKVDQLYGAYVAFMEREGLEIGQLTKRSLGAKMSEMYGDKYKRVRLRDGDKLTWAYRGVRFRDE